MHENHTLEYSENTFLLKAWKISNSQTGDLDIIKSVMSLNSIGNFQ